MRYAFRIFAAVLLALTVRWLFRALRQDRRPIPEAALVTDGSLLQIEGIDVHYRREGGRLPVVLAHGFLGSTQTWLSVSKALSRKVSAISVDLPGSGLSGKPPNFDYSPDAQGKVLARFIEAMCAGPVVLAATSANARAVLHAVSLVKVDVKLVVLLSPILKVSLPFDWNSMDGTLRRRALEIVLSSRRLLRVAIGWLSGSAPTVSGAVEAVYMEGRTPGRVAALDRAIGMLLNGDRLAEAGAVQVPVRVIVGGRDPLAPLLGLNALRTLATDVSATVLPDCAHMLELQAPEQVAALIERYIDELT